MVDDTITPLSRKFVSLVIICLMAFSFSSASKSEAAPSAGSGQLCTITGTSGNDVLNGTSGVDVICGLGGNDTINGLSGNDIIDGGSGNDTIIGGAGDDTISGGDGNDRLSGNDGNDVLKGEKGNDGLIGGKGSDVLSGANGEPALNERNLCEKDLTDTVTYCGFDNSAPWIVSATMSRTTVDSSTSSQTVAVTIYVTDDLMGVDAVRCNLLLEGSRSFAGQWTAVRTAGDSIAGTYTCNAVIPAAASVGRYGVGFVTVDKVGNTGFADQFTGLKNHGDLPEIISQTPEHWIRQAGPGDHESPRITNVIFSRTKIDTSAGPATFSVQMKVTDDSSGVSAVGCIAKHNSVEYINNSKGGAPKISGTDKAGIYRCDITLPKNSGKGNWYLRIYTVDRTSQSYTIQGVPNSSNEWSVDDSLQGAQPTTNLGINFITQTGSGDDELPVMTGISLDKSTVNTSAGNQTIVARVKVKDIKSGIKTVELESFSPTTFAENPATCIALSKDGKGNEVWSCSLTLRRGSAKGLHAFSITLRDNVGNRVTYDSDSEFKGLWQMKPFNSFLADIVKSLDLGPTGVMNTD
jgi:Ca2+-binding RTX toxin-like protein